MNETRLPNLFACTLVAGIAVIAAMPATAAVDCAAPAGVEQRRACKAAMEGAQSLRRFRDRTRVIYAIHLQDYANAVATAQRDAARVAVRSK